MYIYIHIYIYSTCICVYVYSIHNDPEVVENFSCGFDHRPGVVGGAATSLKRGGARAWGVDQN